MAAVAVAVADRLVVCVITAQEMVGLAEVAEVIKLVAVMPMHRLVYVVEVVAVVVQNLLLI